MVLETEISIGETEVDHGKLWTGLRVAFGMLATEPGRLDLDRCQLL